MSQNIRIIFALWFLGLINYLERVAIGFAGPSIMGTLHMSPGQFGIILSSFGVGYVLAQLPGGLLADRWGAKTMLVIGPLLWALFTGLTGFAATLTAFVVVRVCFGFSEGISNTSIYKAVGDNFPAGQRSKVLAICATAIPLAPAFAGLAIGELISTYGWQATFLIMVVPSVVASLFCYSLLPAKPVLAAPLESDGATDSGSFRDMLKLRSLWLFAFAAFLWNIPYWGFLGWMPSYLSMAHHIDIKSAGALGGLIYFFAFLGMLTGGWLGSTLFERNTPLLVGIAMFGAAIGLIVAFRGDSLTVTIFGLSVAAFFQFGNVGPVGKIALDLAPPRYRASYVGTYNTAGQIGGALAPAVIGGLVGATGSFAAGFTLMICALAMSATCLLALIPYVRRGRERLARLAASDVSQA